jgi:phosphate transport system substrate-binding protein
LLRRTIFLALAATIPDASCKLVPNPHRLWSDINEELPALPIKFFGPSLAHGKRSTFAKRAMIAGAEDDPCMAALEEDSPGTIKKLGGTIRQDGAWTDFEGSREALLERLDKHGASLAVISYRDTKLLASAVELVRVDGRAPTKLTLRNGTYPLTTPLFMYVHDERIGEDPIMTRFKERFLDPSAIGSSGYLAGLGLIPR